MRQGVLTANLAAASGWDTTDTLAVNLAESAGALDWDLAGLRADRAARSAWSTTNCSPTKTRR